MSYSESLEMYLETILELEGKEHPVHSVDVAKALDVSKPSVNRALKILKEDGLIEHEPYGSIRFTSKGLALAEDVKMRHVCITKYLVQTLGVPLPIAEKDACRMEHIISPETLSAIRNLVGRQTA